MRRVILATVLGALALSLSACATTSTRQLALAPEVVEAEKEKQRQLALETQQEQLQRLQDVAYPILLHGVPLCEDDTMPRAGFQFANRHTFEEEWRRAAGAALGIGDSVQMTAVADSSAADRAGLKAGDRLVELEGWPVPAGPDAVESFSDRLDGLKEAGASSLDLAWRRDGQRMSGQVRLDTACKYGVQVVQTNALNAFADGDNIYLTSSMMRFTEDRELRVVVAHEFAHNAMDHIEAKQQNAILGALVGVLGDVAAAAGGYNTGGYYTAQGAELGGEAYSQDFEREADYVGLYAMALAGHPLQEAPTFWRHMAVANPEAIGLAYTHPTTAERFVRMERAIEEISGKKKSGLPLRPINEDEYDAENETDMEDQSEAEMQPSAYGLEYVDFSHLDKTKVNFQMEARECIRLAREATLGTPLEATKAVIKKLAVQCLSEDFGWVALTGEESER